MREPTGHYDDGYGDCFRDGDPWPCETWARWARTKEYRIRELERVRKDQDGSIIRLNKQVADLDEKLHRTETMLKGIWPALTDLLAGKTGGTLSVSQHREYAEFHHGMSTARIPTLVEYNVDYTGPDGSEYRNGQWARTEIRSVQ